MENQENKKLVNVEMSKKTMTVRFLLTTATAFANENEPWNSIDEGFEFSKMENLQLDFSEVKFLSSVTLGKILHLNRKYRDQVELLNVNDRIMEVFLVSGLDRVVKIKRQQEKPKVHSLVGHRA